MTSKIFKKYFKGRPQPTDFREYYRRSCDEGGWLHIVGSYRDLVTHACPMFMADSQLWIRIEGLSLVGDKVIPKVLAPIPKNPATIKLERNTPGEFYKFEKRLRDFVGDSNDAANSQDILTYATSVMRNFSDFIWRLSEEVPYKGVTYTVKSSEIIGEIEIIER
ncbi:hypothetical protein GCM10027428_23720 [Haliea atlantica]